MEAFLGLFLLLAPFIFGYFWFKSYRKYKKLYEKYEEIIEIDEEIEKREKELIDYGVKKDIYNRLKEQIAIYDDEIEMIELGLYKPQFDFDDSELYKDKLNRIRAKQKEMMSDKTAIICTQEWTVEGSKSKGKTMTNRNIRLVSRAFNNECDAIISKVKWNNVQKAKERIVKATDAINKLSESMAININSDYLSLKLKELALTHEYIEKKQEEKEQQAEIRQQMREETKLEQEVLKAQKEEEKYIKMFEKAKSDAEKSTGSKLEVLQEKMKQLENDLFEAHSKSQRAKSMAEQTRAGHVYIISNIGSFGENVYKIGMTRRLEPLDRVKELGDASVPFVFDVHAMIYSEDAPGMEKSLHRAFEDKRVNLVNNRKEFFKVSLDEIKVKAQNYMKDVEFIETIEAREYRESLSIRLKKEEIVNEEFPPSL